MKFYFLRTYKEESSNRLRPLMGQMDSNNVPVRTDLNVQANAEKRRHYPIGTIFCSASLQMNTSSATPFYSAGEITPIGLSANEYRAGEEPTPEMTKAWVSYTLDNPDYDKDMLFGDSASVKAASVNSATLLSQIRSDKKYRKPTIGEDGFYISDRNWNLLLRNIITKTNTMLVGPTGTGKTELVRLACSKLGIECNDFDMGSMHDAISEMLGVHRLDSNGSVFDYAHFTEVIQRPGVVLLDELSRAPVTTNNILFPCLDCRRRLPVEMAGCKDTRDIKVHPDCVFIATANIGAEYTGTMTIDRALKGRFFPMELSFMPPEEEAQVLINRFGIRKSDATNIVDTANQIRDIARKGELSDSVSTRETLMAASLTRDGWSVTEALELTFLPLFEGTVTEGERSIVAKIFLSR